MTNPQFETPGTSTPQQPDSPYSDPTRPDTAPPTRQPVPSTPDHDPGPPVRIVDPMLDDPMPQDDPGGTGGDITP